MPGGNKMIEMNYDVFVSYSTKDKAVADAVVFALEKKGIRCWYAPRDIKAGASWGETITEAISHCKLMLLIFSGSSNQSKRVQEEVYYAISEEKTLIPFRIENLDPTGAMRLHLSMLHWLDAYQPSWQANIERLTNSVSISLALSAPTRDAEEEALAPVVSEPMKVKAKKTSWLWIGLAVLLTAILGTAGYWWLGGRGGGEDSLASVLVQESETATASVLPSQTRTQNPTTTLTLPPTQTPTFLPTKTQIPLETPTPMPTELPAWVSEFADPILEITSSHLANIQSSFDEFPYWLKFGDCPDFMLPKITNGELVWTGCTMTWSMWYTDFVIEMDIRHINIPHGWAFNFRGVPGYTFDQYHIGRMATDGSVVDDVSISLADPYQVRILVQEYETALFVDDQPMLYGNLPVIYKNGKAEWFTGEDLSVAFDNIRIWNLNDLK
jgi:hypothetical protein